MKTSNKLLVILLALLPTASAYSQRSFDFCYDFSKRWGEYQQLSVDDFASLRKRFFKDSVSVEEMKEAFFKNKNTRFRKSVYEDFDSVVYMGGGNGEGAMLISPLKNHPNKKVRECRGVWGWNCKLLDLYNKDGVPQKKLLEKINSDKKRIWLDGDIIKLDEPQWYMGFIVSPNPHWDIYDEGNLMIKVGYRHHGEPDFFTFANVSKFVLDGNWTSRIDAGAKLIGAMHGIQSSVNLHTPERTFSVLLHEKPRPKGKSRAWTEYTLELLEPETPDKETETLFNDFKKFVEEIPAKAFKPYYTTDFRIMTGRYYRVTVNKCGWLVEDYLYINK